MRIRQITKKWVQFIVLISFFLLSILAFCCAIEASNPDVEEAFEEDEDEDSIQRYIYQSLNKGTLLRGIDNKTPKRKVMFFSQ
jgi:hypothetical protein